MSCLFSVHFSECGAVIGNTTCPGGSCCRYVCTHYAPVVVCVCMCVWIFGLLRDRLTLALPLLLLLPPPLLMAKPLQRVVGFSAFASWLPLMLPEPRTRQWAYACSHLIPLSSVSPPLPFSPVTLVVMSLALTLLTLTFLFPYPPPRYPSLPFSAAGFCGNDIDYCGAGCQGGPCLGVCTALHRTALHCTAPHHTAQHHTIPHCTALHDSARQQRIWTTLAASRQKDK